MDDLSFERGLQSLGEGKPQHLHVLLVGLGIASGFGQALRQKKMRATGQERRAVHDTQRAVPSGHEAGLLSQLAARAFRRVLAFIECPSGYLPRRDIPCVAPLAHEESVSIVETRNDERGDWLLKHWVC